MPFSTHSPIFKIRPATKPPISTRAKLILPMVVSFRGLFWSVEQPDEYHRIECPTSFSLSLVGYYLLRSQLACVQRSNAKAQFDCNHSRAAKQPSELSPRRRFA